MAATRIPEIALLAPLPAEDPLTKDQWRTILALADAVIPSIQPKSDSRSSTKLSFPDDEYSEAVAGIVGTVPPSTQRSVVLSYLAENASSIPAFVEQIYRLLSFYLPQSEKKQMLMVLNILNYRAGSLVLTGYTTPIADQPVHIREAIIKGWALSRIPALRQLQRSLVMLFKQTWIKASPTVPQILGYPRIPVDSVLGEAFDFNFIQIPPGSAPEIIETDVVIVGSGIGAGVSARNLAAAGHRVLVVDKGFYWPPKYFPMTEMVALNHMFMNGAFTLSDDSTTSVIAGQTWGGGGTVNWSASLQTQGFVRKDWADGGLPFFTSAEFQACLDRVCDFMGVSDKHIVQNSSNSYLMEGARKLGWAHKAVPQNTAGKPHNCGHCTLGCGSAEKQGPAVSWLPKAAQDGARFIEGLDIHNILFENRSGEKVAVGVRGTWRSRDENGGVAGTPTTTREVIIKAKRVVVSAGTMNSPLLLLRSGLNNYHIGRNLYLHPVSLLGAIYDEETRPWDGPILTSVVSEFENLDGKGHGVKLEATNMIPSSWLIWPQWQGGLEYKRLAARMKNMCGYISVPRDRDTGRVYADPHDGRVRFEYHPSAFDKRHIMEGILALAKIQYVAGAREIFTMMPGVPTFVRKDPPSTPSSSVEAVLSDPGSPDTTTTGINDPEFTDWLDLVRKTGFPYPEMVFVSAHQMGTCRMAASSKKGVVDPKGRVWGTQGLFVADASVFPTASGVNPMVTNLAISDFISRGIARGLEREQGARL